MMAETSSAKTMEKPAPEPTFRISSTGSRETTAKADQHGGEQHTDQVPHTGPHHRDVGLERVGVNHCGHCIGGIVESIDELKPEGNQQGE